jgi:hypothetical protein
MQMQRRHLTRTTALGIFAAVCSVLGGGIAMAYEEPAYEVVAKHQDFELRRYRPFVVAEVRVEDGFEDAGRQAFGILFDYISGANRATTRIEMTVPVTQVAPHGEKIEMTAPVLQRPGSQEAYLVSFVLPQRFDLTSAPRPVDARVNLRRVPPRFMAVIRYSGSWSQARYREHESQLRTALRSTSYEATGTPEWARYNAPFVPWFLRRNEILVEVREPALDTAADREPGHTSAAAM